MEILKINAGYVLRKKSSKKRTRLPDQVISILTPEAQTKHLAESDEPMEIDDDPAHPGINPNEVDLDDNGLDDLIFIVDDHQGEEEVISVEAMEVDVGLINVNAAGDLTVQDGSQP